MDRFGLLTDERSICGRWLPRFQTETITRLLDRSTHEILNDTTLLDHPEHKHYFYKQIGTHNGLFIYELNADKRTDR